MWSSLYVLITCFCISAIEQVGCKGTGDTSMPMKKSKLNTRIDWLYSSKYAVVKVNLFTYLLYEMKYLLYEMKLVADALVIAISLRHTTDLGI